MEKLIIDTEGNLILNSLKFDCCKDCIVHHTKDGYGHIKCEIDSIDKRIATTSTSSGSVFVCASNASTTKNFKALVAELVGTISELKRTREEVIEQVNVQGSEKINRLVHNLKNINAHLIQELYNLIPQELFSGKLSKMCTRVEKVVASSPKETAYCLLRIARINAGLKAEVTVYENLYKKDPQVSYRSYYLDSVFMLVLNEFFSDFHAKNVFVNVDDFHKKINFDFESFRVALYHIFENATKYVLSNSRITITFNEDKQNNRICIAIQMVSYALRPDEKDLIFNDGYSGEQARANNKAGKGIGMYIAKRLMQLNNGDIELIPGIKNTKWHDGIEYAENLILISMAKNTTI